MLAIECIKMPTKSKQQENKRDLAMSCQNGPSRSFLTSKLRKHLVEMRVCISTVPHPQLFGNETDG